MLTLVIDDGELWNEEKQEFVYIKGQTIQLEHSLISISKWEMKWNIPFFKKDNKTTEQTLDYIRCMCIDKNVSNDIFENLSNKNIELINDYIQAPMTATTFGKSNKPPNREILTSELIYYYMIAYNIPFECQKWHINRLLTLIQVCNIKNEPPKKMSKRQLASRNTALNAARRAKLGTKG